MDPIEAAGFYATARHGTRAPDARTDQGTATVSNHYCQRERGLPSIFAPRCDR